MLAKFAKAEIRRRGRAGESPAVLAAEYELSVNYVTDLVAHDDAARTNIRARNLGRPPERQTWQAYQQAHPGVPPIEWPADMLRRYLKWSHTASRRDAPTTLDTILVGTMGA